MMVFLKSNRLKLILIGLVVLLVSGFAFATSVVLAVGSNLEREAPIFSSSSLTTPIVISATCRNLLEKYEPNPQKFKEYEVGNLIVCWYQRMIDSAFVEKDQIVYQFDKDSKKLVKKIFDWREGLPEHLPPILVTKERAESKIKGKVQFSNLFYISPESDVFPLKPTPKNPCWIVTSTDNGRQKVIVVDAVTGRVLGNGVPVPYTGFSLSGPIQWYDEPCGGAWQSWYLNAESWFEAMGYPTDAIEWPTEAQVKSYVQDNNNPLFYELAHGDSMAFGSGCAGGNNLEFTYSNEVESWIASYNKKHFTFLGSCDGMCYTEMLPSPPYPSDTPSLSHAFRKGSTTDTTTTGYCGMSEVQCDNCWSYSVLWQEDLFFHMSQGTTVKTAFDGANADYPSCGSNDCMRFAGDPNFAIETSYGLPCGTTIKEDITLKQDILNCPDPAIGLYIGADGITLDCDGHTIDGDGTGGTGVAIWYRTGVTVKNCIIQDFADGITLGGGSSGNEIFSNTLSNNYYGIYLYSGITSNTFWNNDFIGNANYNAFEYSNGNNWDYNQVGNYWDNFSSNSGYPYEYVIPGPGNGIDHYPEGALKKPGALCNANSECGSSYCEGSVSNAKRCCGSQPPNDDWYGGGNTFGCGTDPNSDYKDYYCNASGNAQYETTDTKNCDGQDNCSTWCQGNSRMNGIDYYVITNTNTCASEGGGAIEDCTTKTSSDTDGGNVPLTFGTLKDYNACSSGQCVGPDYNDVCQTTTNLLEYFSNLASYLTQNWLCDSFEVAASDPDGNDPSQTTTCTAGTGAGCSSGQFSTSAGSGGTDQCTGTCGTGPNSCVFKEYYPADSITDACPGLDTCTTQNYDADTNSNTCNTCKGANFWNLGGDVANCCGDDLNEYKKTRVCESDACNSAPSDDACCNAGNKCVYSSTCYADGYTGDVDADSKDEKCLSGVWIAIVIGDPLAPTLLTPPDGTNFVFQDLVFSWKAATGTTPKKYWLDGWVDGQHTPLLPEGGADMGLLTTFTFKSKDVEVSAKDGTWEWAVAAEYAAEPGVKHWSARWKINKHTGATLIVPVEGKAVVLNELFDWNDVTGAKNYVVKLTGFIPYGAPYYLPLNSQQSQFTLAKAYYDLLKSGVTYTWAVAGTGLGYTLSDQDQRLKLLSYCPARSFTKAK